MRWTRHIYIVLKSGLVRFSSLFTIQSGNRYFAAQNDWRIILYRKDTSAFRTQLAVAEALWWISEMARENIHIMLRTITFWYLPFFMKARDFLVLTYGYTCFNLYRFLKLYSNQVTLLCCWPLAKTHEDGRKTCPVADQWQLLWPRLLDWRAI